MAPLSISILQKSSLMSSGAFIGLVFFMTVSGNFKAWSFFSYLTYCHCRPELWTLKSAEKCKKNIVLKQFSNHILFGSLKFRFVGWDFIEGYLEWAFFIVGKSYTTTCLSAFKCVLKEYMVIKIYVFIPVL